MPRNHLKAYALASAILLFPLAHGAAATPPTPQNQCHHDRTVFDPRQADNLLQGIYTFKGYAPVTLGLDLSWNEDPFRAASWRFRLHTLAWTEALRVAWLETGDPTYLERWSAIWRDWIADNPRANPPSFFSYNDHSTAYRAKLLACFYGPLSEDWVEPLMRAHATLLADPAFYVGRSNHALEQVMGLLSIGCVLGEEEWITLAELRFTKLLAVSIDAQGATDEGSITYALFNHARYREALFRLNACDRQPPRMLVERLPMLGRFIAHGTLPHGRVALIGDGGDNRPSASIGPEVAYAVSGGTQGRRPAKTTAIYRGGWIFGRSSWDQSRFRDATAYTLRTAHASKYHAHDDLGHLSIYAYGRRLLEDGGFHRYWDENNRYFYRPPAHNLITVGGSQWKVRATPRILVQRTMPHFDAFTIDLPVWEGVRWTRRVLYSRTGNYFIVQDDLSSPSPKTYRQLWHLPPATPVRLGAASAWTTHSRGNVHLTFKGHDRLTETIGQSSPMQGWMSLTAGGKQPSPTISAITRSTTARFTTVILPSLGRADPTRVQALTSTPHGFQARIRVGNRVEVATFDRSLVSLR